jgi:hypothetical protein
MLVLHFLVLSYLFNNRVKEMKANKVHPEKLKLRVNTAIELKNSCAADNFLNLFEMPIVFYVLAILAITSNKYTNSTVVIAWIFVFSRYVHSFIHCTYNKVMDRFKAFAISNLVLLILLINVFFNLV